MSAGGLIWLLVPFLDKKSKGNERSPLWMWFGVIVVAFILMMTIWGYLIK
jgi:cytochrome b6